MMRPPSAGTTMTNHPRCASAGEAVAVEKRPKKKRLVANAISASRPLARRAPTTPMPAASGATSSTRLVDVKSPRSSTASCDGLCTVRSARAACPVIFEEHRRCARGAIHRERELAERGGELPPARGRQLFDPAYQAILRHVWCLRGDTRALRG